MIVVGFSQAASGSGGKIDFDQARILLQKERGGQPLTPEEKAYLNRAREARQKGTDNRSERATGEPNQRRATQRLIPLTDLGADESYLGQDGGLYGNGMNTPPESLRVKALAELNEIQPLDESGRPSSSGKVVFVSISMSNATQEFLT